MLIFFRVDASNVIGTGHVMRCLTFAKALRDQKNSECIFICRDQNGNLNHRISKEGFEVKCLISTKGEPIVNKINNEDILTHAHWLGVDWKVDALQTLEMLDGKSADWLVIDHYSIDARWQKIVRPRAKKILVIDDLADRRHDCEILLDQNIISSYGTRYNSLLKTNCIKLLGPSYALLQAEYSELHPRIPPRMGPVKSILLFLGSDQSRVYEKVISAFIALGYKDIVLDVLVSNNLESLKDIRLLTKNHKNIFVHGECPSLAPLIIKADLAIGGSGATTWERCCLGLPTLVVTLADNQVPIAAELNKMGLVRLIGDHQSITEKTISESLDDAIKNMHLENFSLACKSLLDGKGVNRVIEFMDYENGAEYKARLVGLDDENNFLSYFNTLWFRGETSCDRSFFYEILRHIEKYAIYIIETNELQAVGYVIFEKNENIWDAKCIVTNEYIPCNLGSILLKTALRAFRNSKRESITFGRFKILDRFVDISTDPKKVHGLSIAICSDRNSWMNYFIPDLIFTWEKLGHICSWSHDANDLPSGDFCFYFSYGHIVNREIRSKFHHNLVVHASDLPKGRGWSPVSWKILEGNNYLPVVLLEAEDEVDSGLIYYKKWLDIHPSDLVEDWRKKLANISFELAEKFVDSYPEAINIASKQIGQASFYPKRKPSDGELDVEKTIIQQFNLLRISDNEAYPAFFRIEGEEFVLKINKRR